MAATYHGTTVSGLQLDVAHDRTLRDHLQGKAVSDGKLGTLTAVHELSALHALNGKHTVLHPLVLVRVTELHKGNGGSTSGVVDNLADSSLNESTTLSEVQRTELGGTLWREREREMTKMVNTTKPFHTFLLWVCAVKMLPAPLRCDKMHFPIVVL